MDPTSSPIFKKQLSQISLSPAPKSIISQPRDGANSVEGVGGGEGRGRGGKEEEEKEEQEEEERQVWPVSEDRPSSPSFTTWVGQAMAMNAVRSKVSVFFPRGSS